MVLWIPAAAVAVIACVAVIFPRAPTWQIQEMRYSGLSFGTDMSLNVHIDLGLEVFNPNYIPAKLKGIVMTLFHEDLNGEEGPYGVVSVRKTEPARLPARGSRVVQATIEIVSLPMKMAMGMAKDVMDGGTLISKSHAVMDVAVLGGDILIEADCVQHIQADVFPLKITHTECAYFYKDTWVPVLPP